MSASPSSKVLRTLLSAAKASRRRAHAPYSGFHIGAAVRSSDGRIHAGCNVENASYGGTVCAERVAVFKAISEGVKGPLTDVCVVSEASPPWPPCGFCRQVLAEFSTPDTRIHLASPRRIERTMLLKELFPEGFGPTNIKSGKSRRGLKR